jgi:4-hydroxythreonine-4-phosphate dehydrogenase
MGLDADRRSKPLALTMGDPAGIGLEIALIAWRDRASADVPVFALYGCPSALEARSRETGLSVPITAIDRLADAPSAFSSALPVLPLSLAAPVRAGTPDTRNAPAVIAAIERAVAAVQDGDAAAVVTNTIAKSVLQQAGFAHPGHTEFLGHLAEVRGGGKSVKPVMMLASDELRVVPLTVHIPLAKVPPLVTRSAIIDTIRIMQDALRRDFAISAPRIAVTGLNPHAGESGTLGSEDRDIIAPALDELRAEGISITGPHPADTLFHAEARKTYDAVLAMYHDQALIPLKTLAFDSGVNVTLGLPFVRTSPDHGTAFDIAGRGVASPRSLIEALKLAAKMAARRAEASQAERRAP